MMMVGVRMRTPTERSGQDSRRCVMCVFINFFITTLPRPCDSNLYTTRMDAPYGVSAVTMGTPTSNEMCMSIKARSSYR